MSNTLTAKGRRSDVLRVLIVDDDLREQAVVTEAIGECDHIEFLKCYSIGDVCGIPAGARVDVCILDIMFGGVNEIDQLLPIVRYKWPRAIYVILSNFIGDFDRDHSPTVHGVFRKTDFIINPNELLRLLNDKIDSSDAIDAVLRSKLCDHFDQRIGELDPRSGQEVLLEVIGYVIDAHAPYVEVVIEDVSDDDGVSDLSSNSRTARKPAYRHILMRYDVFQAAGILDEDMEFSYRVVRDGSKIISEVSPLPDAALPHNRGEMAHAFSHLEKLQRLQMELLSSEEQEYED